MSTVAHGNNSDLYLIDVILLGQKWITKLFDYSFEIN
jgi:hypothetical protein